MVRSTNIMQGQDSCNVFTRDEWKSSSNKSLSAVGSLDANNLHTQKCRRHIASQSFIFR